MSDLLHSALAFAAEGFSVVPTRPDGTKAPAAYWKQYIARAAIPDEIEGWISSGDYDGFGLVMGAVSGNAGMLEWEGRATSLITTYADLADASGLGEIWKSVTAGYLETTPSGGLHTIYRVSDGLEHGNTKLAKDAGGHVLIETRGEGGYVVVAPSAGRTHPTGRAWTLIQGGPDQVATITCDERDALHQLAHMLDQTPGLEPAPFAAPAAARAEGGLAPGEDYNQRATWTELLIPRGWQLVYTHGGQGYWRRPGKTIGVSATTGRGDHDNLYVFTTSTEFDAERPYSKFGAYTLLNHGGDYSAAARALKADRYGTPAPEPIRHLAAVPGPDAYTRTDDGNALRLVDTHSKVIRYVPERGQWLTWTGSRWLYDTAGNIREHARATARDLPGIDKTDQAHRRRSLSGQALGHMVRIAQTDPRIVTSVDHLDARPYELNTPGGVIDLRTGGLRPPDPTALHTRSTNVTPDPTTTPTHWLTFLADTFAGDPTLTLYIQRLLGVSLIGTVLEQLLPFCYGEGANGKTTLIGTVQRIIGIGETGYSISAPAEMLLATANTGHPTEIARLAGARLVVTSELEDGQRFAEAKVKLLTGRDSISGRFMRQDWFTFTPTHTLWLLANYQPAVRAGGPAFWRRLRTLPFLHTVPTQLRQTDLEDRLVEDEGPAILAWLVTGAADYLTHGMPESAAVTTATDAYAADQDTVTRFVEELCTTGPVNAPHLRATVASVRASYETWCHQEGEHPVTAKALTLALRSRFDVEAERTRTARYYLGIRLDDIDKNLSPDPSPADDPSQPWWDK